MKRVTYSALVLLGMTVAPLANAQFVVPSGSVGNSGNANVGIGNTNPFAKLDVEGKVNIGTGTAQNTFLSSDAQLQILTDTNVATQVTFWQSGVALTHMGHKALDSNFYITNAYDGSALGTPARSITLGTTGNVGIGTDSPTGKLQLGITNLWNVNEGLELARLGAPSRFSFKLKSDAGGYYRGAIEFTPAFGSVSEVISIGNESLGNPGVGNVGIGTTLPGARLEVRGDETRLRAIVNKNDGTLRNLLRLTSDDSVGTNNLELALGLQGGTGGNRRAQIQAADNGYYWAALALNPNGGNVGIGMVNPPSTLSVAGDTYLIKGSTALLGTYDSHDLRLLGAAATGAAGKGVFIDYFNGTNWFKAAQIKNVSAGFGSLLLMQDGGNVGIGTSNPTNKLEVNGTIRTKEVVVETTGWSDYVFADGYRLAPLSEVEAHIKANKHLPGIPSATEVAEKGVSLGEMQARLLAKIEEITLRQIAQEKEIAALRAENAALRAQRTAP